MHKSDFRQIIKSVVEGYNRIAPKFHHTRCRFFRDLKFVKEYVNETSTVLDFGCGNGRLINLLGNNFKSYLGLDTSRELLEIAKREHPDGKTKFQKIRPLEKLDHFYDSFNVVYAIAVFHHLPDSRYRLERAKELYKTLKDDGVVVVSVWNLWQKKYLKEIFKELLKKIKGESKLGWKSLYVSFKTENYFFWRYHHAFTLGELRRLFEKAGFETEKALKTKRNLVYIGRK